MSEIIERAADALISDFKVQVEESAGKPFSETGVTLPHRSIWQRKARAVFEATREPTEAMTQVGNTCTDWADGADEAWRLMVNEALR